MKEWLEPLFEKAAVQKGSKKNWFDGSVPIFIYGTGVFAQDVYRAMLQNGRVVSAFLDHRQPVPRSLNGVPVMHPESARGTVVLLGIHNRDADVLSIIRKLERIGVKHIVSPVEIYDFLDDLLGVRYWLTNRDFYTHCKFLIEEAYSLLADDSSRSLYSSVLEFRVTGNYEVLPAPDFENQYFPPDIPAWETPLRLVDCGAFDGDTLLAFANAGIKINAAAAFEPDLLNFAKLSQYVSLHKDEINQIMLFPCGVYSTAAQLTFETSQGSASSISGDSKAVIQCLTLDESIPTFAPNLIKMDIEGAEYDALLGARQLISAHTPGLAISLYHRPEHLWQLPLLAKNIAPGKYNFYMRSHALNDFELVLYAIPKRAL